MTARNQAVGAAVGIDQLQQRRRGPLRGLLRFARAKPLGAFSAVVLLLLMLVAVFAPAIAPYAPNENHPRDRLLRPGSYPRDQQQAGGRYLLGTDQFGRDILSRLLHGARISVQVGVLATAIGVVVASAIGITTAYFRGPWDYFMGRAVDVVQALPGLVLLITLLAVVGRSLYSVSLVLGLTGGIVGSRVIRGATLAVAAQPFVDVARSVGCSPVRILFRYLLVNVFPIMIVLATINVGAAIIAEASLSFLGYGVPPPNPSWGGMLSRDGRQFMVRAPWLFYAPTVALAVVVFSVNMLGDALRDKLDPRLRGST
jgi:peptide/nickel transport system permease protein